METGKLPKLKKTSSGLGFYIFAAILTMYFISIAGIILSFSANNSTDNSSVLLLDNIVSITSFFIVGILYCVISRTSVSEILPVNSVKPALCFKTVAIALAVAFVADYATELISSSFGLFGIHNNVNMSYETKNPIEFILSVISVAVIPPIAEEFAFRGIILQKLRKYGDGFAIFASAALFGLTHGNIVQIPFAFFVGIAAGFITVKTNSIIPAVITHFCVNFSAVVVSIIEENKIFDIVMTDAIYYTFMLIVVLIGIFSALSLSKDKDFFKIKKYDEISFKDRLKASASSIGMIFTFIIFGTEIVLSVL